MQDSDINLDAQPVDAATEVSKPVVRTFIILKDTDRKDPTDAPGQCIVPVFRAYVDTGSDGYTDINPESYSASHTVLQTYLDTAQPDDIAGVWWVGRLPLESESDYYRDRMDLERFQVEYIVSIK